VGYGLLVAPQNRREDEDGARHASGSSGLLRLEVSSARVFQSSLKTSVCAVWVVHMAPSWRSRGDEAEDRQFDTMGCVRPNYPKVAIFLVLAQRGILIFGFHYK
jgi:hypothetical protein